MYRTDIDLDADEDIEADITAAREEVRQARCALLLRPGQFSLDARS